MIFNKRTWYIGLLGILLLSLTACETTQQGNTENGETKNSIALKYKALGSTDEAGDYQLDKSYPVGVEEENFDDSLLTNQMDTFLGYEDQGSIKVKANDFSGFSIVVNGVSVDTGELKAGEWNDIDISDASVNGDNNLQVSQVKTSDDKLELKIPYPILLDADSSDTKQDTLTLIDQIIQSEVKNGFTSAQLVITHNGKVIKNEAYGEVNSYEPDGERITDGKKVTKDTLYDLASNTKMYATNYALQHLVSEGKIVLDDKVQSIFPDFKDKDSDKIKGKNELTIREILQHQAGFPADPQYHNQNYDPTADDLNTPNANKLYTQDREQILNKIIETPLEYEPGTNTMYSDVDYMLLGFIIEEVTGQRLDDYVKNNFYEPLNLQHTTFNPLDNGFSKDEVAATELNGNTRDGVIDFENIRKNTIQGEVHDEKAYYSMGGISGHAGLFSNARDLATLTQLMLNKGGYGEKRFFSETVRDDFIKPKDGNSSYGLGWRRKGEQLYSWAFSPLSNTSTVGHTGWVGTLTVIDPIQNMSVVLLTNTKNSPVLDSKKDPNDFWGNHYLTGGYGLISTLAFDSLKNDSKSANDSKLIDMIESKYQLITNNNAYNTKPDKLSLKALIEVLEDRKEKSEVITNFMDSESYKEIQDFLS
ncbi:MAG: penicillin binding protein PBP4B [Bavariicoccus seileri]|uniref:penicillin binding protein PBP4B n=1 Tax=Bavariicoccus seileri TaxID=549685 RepID=UPI003F9BDED5